MIHRRYRIPFPILLSWRSNLGRHRSLTLLTVLAVATSVALATALEMSSRGAERQLALTAAALAGQAEIEVTGGDLGITEKLLDRVAAVSGVERAAPYLQMSVRIAEDPDAGAALYLIGVDLLQDQGVRSYAMGGGDLTVPDPLALLADVRSVLITRQLADRLGLRIGDRLPIVQGKQALELKVRGLLERGGIADAFAGSIAVMDIYSLQTLMGREGWLDRIDIVVSSRHEVSKVMERLRAEVDGAATVRRAAARDEWVDYTMDTLRTVTTSLALVGGIVASLLVFGAISLSVDRRARELALIRTVGLESRRASRLVRIDAFVMAVVGTALGLPLGAALSKALLPLLSGVSEYLQDVEIAGSEMNGVTVVVALTVGLLVANLGSLGPARRAGSQNPLEMLRHSSRTIAEDARAPAGFAVLGMLTLLWIAVSLHGFGLPPLVRVATIFCSGTVVASWGFVLILPRLLRRWRRLLELALPRIGRLAGASLTSRSRATAVTVAAVAGVLAGITATFVMVQSLAGTLDDWIATEYRDAVLITAGSPFAGRDRELVTLATTATIRGVSGVRAASELFTGNILFRGEEVLLVGQSMDVLERFGRLPSIGVEPAELARALAGGKIAVSDAFADHFDVARGDSLDLTTPTGAHRFEVAGTFRDYVGPAGSVQMDIDVLDAHWERSGAYMLAAWVNSPETSVIDAIRQAAGQSQDLFFIHGEDLERYAGEVLGRLTGILDWIAVVMAGLGGVAVTNLLITSVSERRRELALLRSVGASNRQLSALILVDAAIVSLLGATAGIVIGVLCAYPMVTDVLREAFGWSVVFRIPLAQLLVVLGGALLAALLAGLYPAWLARRIVPREVFAPE